jgi:hypothetical protein
MVSELPFLVSTRGKGVKLVKIGLSNGEINSLSVLKFLPFDYYVGNLFAGKLASRTGILVNLILRGTI